jgi:hypothetical protein
LYFQPASYSIQPNDRSSTAKGFAHGRNIRRRANRRAKAHEFVRAESIGLENLLAPLVKPRSIRIDLQKFVRSSRLAAGPIPSTQS